jgi:putative oxidoreductase
MKRMPDRHFTFSNQNRKESIMSNQSHTYYLPAFGRLLMATIFIMSGLSKLAAPAATIAYIGSTGAPLPTLGYGLAVLVELGGGALILLGYKTRSIAPIMALFCVATALMFHHPLGDQNQMIHFLKNIAMAGGFLQLAAFGAGSFSLDSRAARNSDPRILKVA